LAHQFDRRQTLLGRFGLPIGLFIALIVKAAYRKGGLVHPGRID
jgi:hypothetical protein